MTAKSISEGSGGSSSRTVPMNSTLGGVWFADLGGLYYYTSTHGHESAADRVFLPTKNLLEQVGDMMILTGKTLVSAVRPAVPVRHRVRPAVPVHAAALLAAAADHDDLLRLRRTGAPGRELPGHLRSHRPARRLLRPQLGQGVRTDRLRDHPGRRRRHGDHRRPRRPQDPRGARRASGARRRPDQEPRRAALPAR